MSSPPLPETIYLDGSAEPVFAIYHRAAEETARDTAVILCPPFGWDEVCSYRSRRDWAHGLAAAGYATIRITFPGTGDSGGSPRDPAQLQAWIGAVNAAGSWVRAASGAQRTVAVGLGLGGLVAAAAAAGGGPIDDLVLWATPARARALVRQLRAFSKMEVSQFFEGLEQPPPLPPGELEAGGFLLSAETVQELEALDLAAMPFPDAPSRRVLLLERDGIAVDARLQEALESWGVKVTVAPGDGYAAMTSHPQQARPPVGVIERVTAWLDEASASSPPDGARSSASPAGASATAQLQLGQARIQETPLTIEQSFGRLSGVLAEPLGPTAPGLCVVLLNAGAVRRIGPSRMWVEVARRWAARGVPTLRLDVEGIGDADGDASPYTEDAGLYVPELVPQVLATLDVLLERGVGERFVLAGLCAGAYWSFHAALRDPRVSAAFMVNPRALIWDRALAPARDLRAFLSQPTSWSKIREQASVARVRALALWVLAAPKRWLSRSKSHSRLGAVEAKEVDDALDQLHATGKGLLLMFSDHEPLQEELVRSGRMAGLEQWQNLTLEYIPVRDHTLRPNWAQRQAHDALDRALDRELGASPLPEPATPLS